MAHRRSFRVARGLLATAALFASTSSCKPARAPYAESGLVGSWTLASLEEGAEGGSPRRVESTGSLILTRDGRMSVQVMYREVQS